MKSGKATLAVVMALVLRYVSASMSGEAMTMPNKPPDAPQAGYESTATHGNASNRLCQVDRGRNGKYTIAVGYGMVWTL